MSNKLRITVAIDQKAALLKGLVLGKSAEVEVSPADMSAEIWAVLVSGLNMGSTPPALGALVIDGVRGGSLPGLAEPTVVALVAGIGAEVAEVRERERVRRAEYQAKIDAWLADGIHRSKMVDSNGYVWEKWEVDYISERGGILPADWSARKAAHLAIIEPLIAEHNAPHLLAVEQRRAARAVDIAAREKIVRDEKAAALLVRSAARIASGYWERETASYKAARYGAPWCAKVTFPSGAKPVYEWGESTGKWGNAGLLRVACAPGEIIAWGQKDVRWPDRSEHTIAIMRADGSMDEIDKTEAFRLWTAAQKVPV